MNTIKFIAICLLLIPALSQAADGIVNAGVITKVRAYETSDGSTVVYLQINGQNRVGPNPDIPSVNCELWTYTKEVFSIALAAKSSGKKVNIRYIPRGNGDDAFCKVRYLEIID
ncbi:hypothetical protein QSV34_00025 [Porticoccus sp. W117]|uniref:hypothetical protein n=1 Tax=Porticoccus sp. W117 TaxID=3054777 RepID=UPI002593AFFC|nr:hypothetical protein [Porticoccus sp. W117]MDM3869727.1 hypothetical protein [Porticoccus sp. W117]